MADSSFTLRRSARSTRLRVVVDRAGRVEVVAPLGASERSIRAFVGRHTRWIERTRERQLERARASAALGLSERGRVRIDGDWLEVRVVQSRSRTARRAGATIEAPELGTSEAVGRLLRREARRVISERVSAQAGRLGLRPGPIAIRDPRTRWGSCAASGALSFSWRLILAPRSVLDYVVVHELCHLRHHDHSPSFWAAVAAADSDWRRSASWLRAHGAELHRSPF